MAQSKQQIKVRRGESANLWKERLAGQIQDELVRQIDDFETEIYLKKQGKIEDKVFAETRLRRGVYGQRYDNGKRHDGSQDRQIPYPDEGLTKGPNTVWHAPGMLRIKIPWGGLTFEQMEVLADLAEEYSDSILHVTTRQDFQFHFVHIEDMPTVFRRLGAVGITTLEACGNSVRNVTGCPVAGVCSTEVFDTTPYADAFFRFLLGHPDAQDFGRKFKVAFSGCVNKPCAVVRLHDLGFTAKTKTENGKEKRGFEMYVGGGLGAVPYQAKLFDEFVTEEEMLPLTQAICRIFARYGEKKNRNRARIKFLVNDWGIDKFKEEVLKERQILKEDPRWSAYIPSTRTYHENPLHEMDQAEDSGKDPEYQRWLATNVEAQKQSGYSTLTIMLPLGDITSNQMRDLTDIARRYIDGTVRTTVEQNMVFRWVSNADLPQLYQDLKAIHLADVDAGTIVDITACPGTDTCKLGIASSRGLAGELRARFAAKSLQLNESVKNLRIKTSGCFNSCGQHHTADIGFYGISRKSGNYLVPHFQLVLGGQRRENAGSYGMPVVGVPSKAVPAVVDRLTEMFVKGRQKEESFQDFIRRLGKVEIKKSLADLLEIPEHDAKPEFYTDWGDVREFTTSDIGKGECAGEVVSLVDFGLKEADRQAFEAQVLLDDGKHNEAAQQVYRAMLTAAQGLIKGQNPDISNDPDEIVNEFKTRFCDTEIFYDPFARDKFAKYLFRIHQEGSKSLTEDQARKRLEEAHLFIEAAYSCSVRMSMAG